MAQTPINHSIFWNSVVKPFRWNMWIALTDLNILLKSAQNCKKFTFIDKLRAITQEGNLKTRQMTSFFHLLFLFVIFIFVFENIQNSFSCCAPFDPFWFVKFQNSQQKLPISTIHHIFIKSKHPEVAKNPCYVLSSKWSHFILCIVCMWSLFCSVQGYISIFYHSGNVTSL